MVKCIYSELGFQIANRATSWSSLHQVQKYFETNNTATKTGTLYELGRNINIIADGFAR